MTGTFARPARDGSSVAHVIVGLIFASPPEPEAIRRALPLHEVHDVLRERYPRRQQRRAATVAVNADEGVVDEVGPSELAGFSFDFVNPDGNVRRALGCTEQSLRVVRVDRSNLDQVQAEAFEEFDIVLHVLGQGVRNLVLERLDRFVWSGSRTEFRAAHVFRPDTRWLTPNIFDATDMWHTHHGFFSYPGAPHAHRLLHRFQIHTSTGEDARPTEPDATLVVDVKQSLNVLNGVDAPGSDHRVMSAEELLGEHGLLRDYLPDLVNKSETLLSEIVSDGVRP